MPKLSIVFSFYNEEQTLPLLINRVCEVLSNIPEDLELVFVNDASKDRSVEVITQEAFKNKKGKFVLVNMSRRFGVEESFLAGIKAASGDAIVLMYTDLQDPPEIILKMLESYRDGAEIVHTVRRRRIGEHPLKKLAAFIAYRLIGNLSDIKIPLDSGEFKLLSRNVAQHLLNMPEAEPYLRGLIPWIGFKQTYIEYDMPSRSIGKSKVPLFGKKAWTVFLNGIISFSDTPIYWILLCGIFGIFLSLIVGLWLIVSQNLNPMSILIELILFLWSLLMLALGIVGIYLLKTYKNSRQRPHYIIKDLKRLNE